MCSVSIQQPAHLFAQASFADGGYPYVQQPALGAPLAPAYQLVPVGNQNVLLHR
jgi:hypothetical protein